MIVQDGLIGILQKLLLDTDFDLRARLFKTDPGTIDASTELLDLVEADFPGYSAVGGIAFPVPTINGSGEAFSAGPVVEFTRSTTGAAQTIYGWYFTFKDKDDVVELIFAEKFTAPIVLDTAGQKVQRSLNAYLLQAA